MNLSNWLAKQRQNKFTTLSLALLIFAQFLLILILLFAYINKKPIVILTPLRLQENVQVQNNKINPSYAQSFALSMSLLLGNITLENSDFLLKSLANYMHADAYYVLGKQINLDVERLRKEKISLSFLPTKVESLAENKVLVRGISRIIAITGDSIASEIEFVFVLTMLDYQPLIQGLERKVIRELN